MMSECGHEWVMANDCQTIILWCKKCGFSTLDTDDVVAMLNEYVALKRKNELMECVIGEALHSIEHARSALLALDPK